MTNEEILEAQKLIADMRNVLTVLTGTTDVEKLIALMLEQMPPLLRRFDQLGAQGRLTIFGPYLSLLCSALVVMRAYAELAERHSDVKAALVDAVAWQAPRADAVLVRSAQALRDRPPFVENTVEMTKKEIVEAEKLLAGIRDNLSVILGTTDVEKLPVLVLEKVPGMIRSLYEVVRHIPTTIVSGPERDWCDSSLNALLSYVRIEEFAPGYGGSNWKAELVAIVAMYAPDIEANLDKIAHVLREKRQ